jgi:hypothetical protein
MFAQRLTARCPMLLRIGTKKMNPGKPVHARQQAHGLGLIEPRLKSNTRSLPQAHIRCRDIQG